MEDEQKKLPGVGASGAGLRSAVEPIFNIHRAIAEVKSGSAEKAVSDFVGALYQNPILTGGFCVYAKLRR